MFVSGPVGTSVTGRGLETSCSTMKSTAGWPIGRCVGGGSVGPVEAALAVDVGGDPSSRTSGRSAPAATGTSARPTSSSTRSAFAVVFSSVWFPWTVVTPSSSSSGLASASSSAIASS